MPGAVGRILPGCQGVDAGDLVRHLGLVVEAEALAGIADGGLASAESCQEDPAARAEGGIIRVGVNGDVQHTDRLFRAAELFREDTGLGFQGGD